MEEIERTRITEIVPVTRLPSYSWFVLLDVAGLQGE